MTITKIEPVSKTRFQIFLDGKPAFCLYRGELSRYHLVPGAFLEEEAYQKICEEVLVKRAKLRAMHLLNQMGRTEQQLKDKLIRGGYPEEVAEAALCYVKSFGYVNDLEYARSFILGRKSRKSAKEMQAALREKGVSPGRSSKRQWKNAAMATRRRKRSGSCCGKGGMIRIPLPRKRRAKPLLT